MIVIPNLEEAYAIHIYNNPDGGRTLLGEAVYRYQYRKQWYLVDSLARWAQQVIQSNAQFKGVDLLVPIPTSRSLADYDPTSLLVDWVAQLTRIPRAVGVMQRYGLISEYDAVGVAAGTGGGMTVTNADAVKGKRVLLIDGITCTGNTITLATAALKSAGAQSVQALAFTRIDRAVNGFKTEAL